MNNNFVIGKIQDYYNSNKNNIKFLFKQTKTFKEANELFRNELNNYTYVSKDILEQVVYKRMHTSLFNNRNLKKHRLILSTELFKSLNECYLLINNKNVSQLTTKELLKVLMIGNITYRKGIQILSDNDYDHIYLKELETRNPNHPYLDHIDDCDNLEETLIKYKSFLSN
jgi:hypothetical protein